MDDLGVEPRAKGDPPSEEEEEETETEDESEHDDEEEHERRKRDTQDAEDSDVVSEHDANPGSGAPSEVDGDERLEEVEEPVEEGPLHCSS